ncbi:MAG TPA: hypothetical protein VGB63_09390 [Pedobacter sp.]|jgi:hypothetical protein
MEDFDSHFFVSVDEHSYQVIPSDGNSFLVLMEGVKVGGLSKDENSQWQWTDSNLAQDFAEQIGQKIDSHS